MASERFSLTLVILSQHTLCSAQCTACPPRNAKHSHLVHGLQSTCTDLIGLAYKQKGDLCSQTRQSFAVVMQKQILITNRAECLPISSQINNKNTHCIDSLSSLHKNTQILAEGVVSPNNQYGLSDPCRQICPCKRG